MISIVILNPKGEKISNNIICNWNKQSDDVIVIDRSGGLDSNFGKMNDPSKKELGLLLSRLCNSVKYDYFLICTPTSKVSGDLSDALKLQNGDDHNVLFIKTVCIKPGRNSRIDLHSLDFSIYGKLFNKRFISRAPYLKDYSDDNVITSVLCMDQTIDYLQDAFYYESDPSIYRSPILIKDDDKFFEVIDKLPPERQAINIKKWLSSESNLSEKEKKIHSVIKKQYDFASDYYYINRLKGKAGRVFIKLKKNLKKKQKKLRKKWKRHFKRK